MQLELKHNITGGVNICIFNNFTALFKRYLREELFK